MMNRYSKNTVLILTGCVLASVFLAKSATADITINVTADIYAYPCTVNNNSLISVDFGDMQIQKVDGQSYARTVTVPVECSYYTGTPYVNITGTSLSGAPGNVLATNGAGLNSTNLGVALTQGSSVSGAPLTLGAGSGNGYAVTDGVAVDGTGNGQFTFTAVPYKQGTGLSEGAFSASATMSMVYQ
ncbi:fimbrial protein [Buttiauxella ferragutiae]|uniref:fimbrial protein n=1 Tax=Buttiauxella ferragutiae TaxID=82989 RepID=UPI0035251270